MAIFMDHIRPIRASAGAPPPSPSDALLSADCSSLIAAVQTALAPQAQIAHSTECGRFAVAHRDLRCDGRMLPT